VSVAEDALGCRGIQPFGQRRQHYGHVRRRGFQAIQGGVMSGREGGVTGLTPKRLDPLETAVLAISDEGMEESVSGAKVGALLVGTSEAFGVDAFGRSSTAFHLPPGPYRKRRWSSTRGRS
jgi:hypothetical protein